MTSMRNAFTAKNPGETNFHGGGVEVKDEILFFTNFSYMFPHLAENKAGLIKDNKDTPDALVALGKAMVEPPNDPEAYYDSDIPAVFTYLGQFIDHDVTARTDRDGESAAFSIDKPGKVKPQCPENVLRTVLNGRRPTLDLDSVYADGPSLISGPIGDYSESVAEEFGLYERTSLELPVVRVAPKRLDLVRREGRTLVADDRNGENAMISQIQAAFHAFHNTLAASLKGSPAERYVEARRLVRWAYQYVVINEYLPAVCAPDVVKDTLANGPRYLGVAASGQHVAMPLEFSVAAFRFGHTMVRPEYQLNDQSTLTIDKLLFPGKNAANLNPDGTLKDAFLVDWNRFAPGGNAVQFARRLDHRLSLGLSKLSFPAGVQDPLTVLAVRNLLRGYLLSIPTGQAVAQAMGLAPLPKKLLAAEDPLAIMEALKANDFLTRTPLWYYILREAEVHAQGRHLGAVGSRIVAETLVGAVKFDVNSYWNNRWHPAVTEAGIDTGLGVVRGIDDILEIVGVA